MLKYGCTTVPVDTNTTSFVTGVPTYHINVSVSYAVANVVLELRINGIGSTSVDKLLALYADVDGIIVDANSSAYVGPVKFAEFVVRTIVDHTVPASRFVVMYEFTAFDVV